ncbi:MAG TPA: multicopper oxidase domain-containing protein [Myxococcota bacterium]
MGDDPEFYQGPVPLVTHVHGAHVGPESDGYPEAWWLPAARNIPEGYATRGTLFDQYDPSNTAPGSAVFQYPNDQRSATLWYHDHSLGITRLNVYAGPAGFWLLRGADEAALDLPGPWPALHDPPNRDYFEIPIAIQDRSFNRNGSLFYPDNRAFFEGLKPDRLEIDYSPDSDVAPTWNPEAFFNTMVVNGRTWPRLEVQPRKYRLRLLNGCNSRFLILKLATDATAPRPVAPVAASFHQIGSDGGLLPAPVEREALLMGPAERADVIVDFSAFEPGTELYLINEGPDEPFGGGEPGVDFDPADPGSTGQVMKFVVVPLHKPDKSVLPAALPPVPPLVPTSTRRVSLNEEESQEVCVRTKDNGVVEQIHEVEPGPSFAEDCEAAGGEIFGPVAALLGTLGPDGSGMPLLWSDAITENPALGATEMWEIYNFTADAHPIHHLELHQVEVDRQPFDGMPYGPAPGEEGYKDTVIAYPGEVTRIRARFDLEGLYVWHCHILEHEDNEMMRPYCVGDAASCPVPIAAP